MHIQTTTSARFSKLSMGELRAFMEACKSFPDESSVTVQKFVGNPRESGYVTITVTQP